MKTTTPNLTEVAATFQRALTAVEKAQTALAALYRANGHRTPPCLPAQGEPGSALGAHLCMAGRGLRTNLARLAGHPGAGWCDLCRGLCVATKE